MPEGVVFGHRDRESDKFRFKGDKENKENFAALLHSNESPNSPIYEKPAPVRIEEWGMGTKFTVAFDE